MEEAAGCPLGGAHSSLRPRALGVGFPASLLARQAWSRCWLSLFSLGLKTGLSED